MMFYGEWGNVPGHAWIWPNFTPYEMRCRGTGKIGVVIEFMDRLQHLRKSFDRPLIVTSGFRDPEYNNEVSSTGLTGPHTTGRAVDIRISGEDVYLVLRLAYKFGFTGIGVHQRGEFKQRFIHLDDLVEIRPRVWTY